MSIILSSKEASLFYKQTIKEAINIYCRDSKRLPTLAIVIPQADDSSRSYLKSREKLAQELGIRIEKYVYSEIAKIDLFALIQKLNQDPQIDGIIIDRPLPKVIDENEIYDALDPKKDVDGCTALNAGFLLHGRTTIYPSTARAIVELLKFYKIELAGKNVVVVGRSKIVGMPVAKMLLDQNATVTICHSKTTGLAAMCQQAEILVVAIGKKNFIQENFINRQSIVIDVGIHYDEVKGISGDVDKKVYECVAMYSPVPGGVGPLTSIMLMDNLMKIIQVREEYARKEKL